jgi:hypothetical protein
MIEVIGGVMVIMGATALVTWFVLIPIYEFFEDLIQRKRNGPLWRVNKR